MENHRSACSKIARQVLFYSKVAQVPSATLGSSPRAWLLCTSHAVPPLIPDLPLTIPEGCYAAQHTLDGVGTHTSWEGRRTEPAIGLWRTPRAAIIVFIIIIIIIMALRIIAAMAALAALAQDVSGAPTSSFAVVFMAGAAMCTCMLT